MDSMTFGMLKPGLAHGSVRLRQRARSVAECRLVCMTE